MTSGVSGPSDSDPSKPLENISTPQTGIEKTYTASKAPEFKKWLEIWFPGQVSDKMVSEFEQGMMQMIQNSINRAKEQHEKVERQIKENLERE